MLHFSDSSDGTLSIRIRKTVDKWITEVMRKKNVDKQSAAGMPD